MRRAFFLYGVAAVVASSFGSAAGAAVCASTFGAGSSFGGPVYAAQGSATGSRIEWAFPFTPSTDCLLGTADVAFHLQSGPNAVRITVVEEASGLPGITVVDSTTVIGEMTTNSAGSIVRGIFTGANLLSGSSTYWIVVQAEPAAGSTSALWHASPDTFGARAVRFGGGGWLGQASGVHGAFRVTEGPSIPALPLWGFAVLGAALLLFAGILLGARPTRVQPGP